MDGVGTPIIGRPRPLPGHDTPNPAYHPHTLNYEEPLKADKTWDIKIDRTLNNCINPIGKSWKVIVEEDRYGNKPVLRFSRDDRSYVLTLNGDGTVSINNSAKFTITK